VSNSPLSIGEAIKEALRNYGIEKKILQGQIGAEWSMIIGEYLSEKVKIDRFEKDILFLQIDSSAIKNEISIRKKEIINKINNKYGQQVITEIILK
jgi:hypothetical protein